ncbi:butyrophilin subfamily 1 member A1 isoform X3 [Salmo salar]|uniref:Butyrophilin subfamily 1 member A1 isoform X3 n=1 Tax=Salmo salar TaxID=8030 RepID=A0ABM3E9E3_SALSA|nr:butyrophilin subfamily 1 member A1-like isoform X3 [Salmo salar]
MKTFQTSAAWCLGILFISVSLITTGSSEVVGPADPVVALTGDDIILPCSLKPSVSAEDMIVEWTRLNPKAEKVHLYLDSRDSFVDQFPSYRGRTSMFNEELKNGNVSLKLTNVTLSDAGRYRCFIQTLKKETTVQLLVGAVSQPVISIDGTKGWGVVLKCESGGWFPEPQMEWLDSSGTILPADGPPERHRDSEGLYTVRRHVTVNRTGNNRFTCRVNQLEINHLKETEIHVPDEVFPKSQVGLIVGLLIAVAVVVLAASAGVFMWRKHTEEKKCRKQLEKQKIQSTELLEDVNKRKAPSSFVQNLTEQLMAAKKQIEMLSKDKDDVTREKDGLQGQLNDVTREKDGLQGLLNDVTREKDDLQKQTGQLEKLKKDKEKLRNEKDEHIQNLTGEMEKLRNEKDEHIQNLTGEMEKLRNEKDKVIRERDEHIQNLTGEMEKLRNEKDEHIQNLTGEMEKLRNEKDKVIRERESDGMEDMEMGGVF